MTAYLAGGRGLSLLRLSVITLTFSAQKELQEYVEVKSFENGRIKVVSRYTGTQELVEETIDLEAVRSSLHLSRSLISNITNIKLGE